MKAIAYQMDKIIKRQHINALVTMNKLAARKVNVLASEKDCGEPIVAGCFNKYFTLDPVKRGIKDANLVFEGNNHYNALLHIRTKELDGTRAAGIK